jgi:hypothetical protein
MPGAFGDTFFRDVLGSAGSSIREFSAPFMQDILQPAPMTPAQGPDPLGLGMPNSQSWLGAPLGGFEPFNPVSFIDPRRAGSSMLGRMATPTAQQGPQAVLPKGPIAQAVAKTSGAGTGAGGGSGEILTVDPSSPYYGMAVDAAKAVGLDPGQVDIFTRLVAAESGYNPNAHNVSGAAGLTGLMPGTARAVGVTNVYDPQQALMGGARYFKQMLDRYSGNTELALAAYNAGPGNVDAFGGIPPFQETQSYVRKITQKSQAAPQYPQTTPQNEVPPPPPGVRPLQGITTPQYGSEGLATGAADYICGPIAAQAFVRTQGRNPSLQEALDMARRLGVIDPTSGMHGIESTAQLIRSLGGVATVGQVEKNRIINEVQHGRPVIIDTDAGSRGHYFVVEGYDPTTGKFDLGNSARALRASGGNTQYTLEEISGLGFGTPHGAIYAGY